MRMSSAISRINKRGVLLVYPILNKREPASLWYEFHPRKKMLWDWNEDGGEEVAEMWHLMKKLSDSGRVVYSKWYQNRATFFSRQLFAAILKLFHEQNNPKHGLSLASFRILSELENNSPLSTKQIKKLSELQGKDNEATYARAIKSLFHRFLIVAYGEVDDGAFPSLAVGASQLLYEDLWRESQRLTENQAKNVLEKHMPLGTLFRKFYEKTYIEMRKEQNQHLARGNLTL